MRDSFSLREKLNLILKIAVNPISMAADFGWHKAEYNKDLRLGLVMTVKANDSPGIIYAIYRLAYE